MINLNANITSSLPKIDAESFRASKLAPRGLGESGGVKVDFENAVKAAGKYLGRQEHGYYVGGGGGGQGRYELQTACGRAKPAD